METLLKQPAKLLQWTKTETKEKAAMKRQNQWYQLNVVQMVVLALALNLLIELLNHKGVGALFSFIGQHPLAFVVNYCIILFTLSPCLFFRRRVFFLALVGLVWAVGGIANGIIIQNRMTPFTTADLAVFATGFEILPNYFTKFQMVLLGICVVAVIAGGVFLFLRGPKEPVKLGRRLISGLAAVVVTGGMMVGTLQAGLENGSLSTIFSNLAYAYEDYGFAYCFANTWLNTGIQKPKNYSEQDMERIQGLIDQNSDKLPAGTPMTDVNVIYVQLESFFDPQQIEGLTFNQDPLPNWHALQKEFSTGYLTVPVVGAGTANTETEVLTGMRTHFFGPGEYPYKTVFTEQTVESVAYILKNLGYGTHAVHNHRGAFYGRNVVYKNMGFDTFTSLEYMPSTSMTPKNWCKDSVLTGEIEAALDSTDTPDLVFTVSVQGHGKYPGTPILDEPAITVSTIEDENLRYPIEYYANQIYEMDQFIKDLTDMLSQREEKTILVLYGDHLPALQFDEDTLLSHDMYKTEYLIWDNFGLEKDDGSLKAYQLTSHVLGKLNITDGIINRFHQTCQQESTYLTDLRKLQYDALYGEHYLTGGQPAYEPADMKMGVRPITVSEYIKLEENWYIVGENFTPYCKATVNGEILETEYLNSHIMRVLDDEMVQEIQSVEDIKISVVEKYNEVLSVTE